MIIHVKYFASLAQMRGVEEEHIEIKDNYTAQKLYSILKETYAFPFEEKDIKVAINHEYKDFSSQLQHNDTVVFISPVSGG